MKKYEILLEKTVTITVEASDENEAFTKAEETLNSEHGYCEYAQDGYEINYDLKPELIA